MTYYYLLDSNNVVRGVSHVGPFSPVPPGLTAGQGPDLPTYGQVFSNGKFVPAPLPPPTSDQLVAYASKKQTLLSDGGIAVRIDSGQTVQVDTDITGRLDLAGLDALASKDSTFTTTWVQATGSITLNAAQIDEIAVAGGKWRESTFVALSAVLAKIASSTITTFVQIDDDPAWPQVPTG